MSRPRGGDEGLAGLLSPRARGVLGTGGLFLAVQVLALAITPRLSTQGVSYGEGGDALVPLVLGLVLGTLLALAVTRWGLSVAILRGLTFLSVGVSVWFAAAAFLGPLLGVVPAAAGALVVWRVRWWAPRNAVIAVGVAGAAGVFGASLAPRFAVAALVVVAAYDAYSVYYSGHMVELADASARLSLPNAFVVPTSDHADGDVSVSDERADATGEAGDVAGTTETESTPVVAMLGAGDALFPALLAASANAHTATIQVVGGGPPLGVAPSAWGTVAGAVVGFAALQVLVHRRGGVHAGLPAINGGAILGWLATGGVAFL